MNKITTHKGETLLLIEVPLDAYDITKTIMYGGGFELNYTTDKMFDYKHIKFDKDFEIIGTTSTLTNEQVEPFVEQIIYVVKPYKRNIYHSYTNEYETLNTALESWDSFLQHNGIDLTKNYCVLKLLNNE